jgi:hypothetical protein
MKVPNVALDRTMILLHYRMSVIFGALQFRSTPTSAMTRLIAPEMRISVIAGAIAVLPWMWMALPAKAEDVTPVNAAMTVYKYVVGVETLIDECRQIDGVGGVSYDGLKTAYIKLMQSTVVEIAHKDNSKFVEACRALSSRFNARTAPFEAPSTKFPKEMRIIESWLGKNKIQ